MEHYFTNNENLKSEIKYLKYDYLSYHFLFATDYGVFAKDKIDYGSNLLIETILKTNPKANTILDVGCGYGFIGIVLSKVLNTKTDMIDINKRALHLANINIKENKTTASAFESDVYEKINKKYDFIISNPPIHAGKKVVLNILLNAKDYLNENGCLWYVIRKDQGAKSIQKELSKYYNVQNIKKSNGFYIFCAKIN